MGFFSWVCMQISGLKLLRSVLHNACVTNGTEKLAKPNTLFLSSATLRGQIKKFGIHQSLLTINGQVNLGKPIVSIVLDWR